MAVTVSVITPSFNQAAFLDQTLRSVLCQREQIHEYFVLDGGSTDGSVEIIRKYEPLIDWWVSEKDKGQSDAIRKGFERATGDVIGWLNSDDLYLPDAIRKVREAFERHPEWQVITSDYLIVDERTRIRGAYRRGPQKVRMARLGQWVICQQGCFFRRSLYEKVGGVDVSLHCVMDADLWARFFQAEAVWGHVPEYLAAFRLHSESKTSSWTNQWDRELAIAADRYPAFYPSGGKKRVGRAAYLARQALTMRQLRAFADTLRWREKHLGEFCGGWRLSLASLSASCT